MFYYGFTAERKVSCPYIYWCAQGKWTVPGWMVSKPGADLNDGKGHWDDHGAKWFSVLSKTKQEVLVEVKAWVDARYKRTHDWVPGHSVPMVLGTSSSGGLPPS